MPAIKPVTEDVIAAQGDIFVIENRRCRIINIDSDIVFYIGMDNLFIEKQESGLFMGKVVKGTFKKESASSKQYDCALSQEENLRISKMAGIFEEILSNQYPAWEAFVGKGLKQRTIHEGAKALNITVRHFKRLFIRYLRSGRDRYSLVDARHFNKVSKETEQASIMSKSAADVIDQLYELSEQERQLQEALLVFKKTLSVSEAYHYLLEHYYRIPQYVDGVLKYVLLPEEQRISYRRVHYYISHNLGGKTISEYKKGEREYRNNSRPLTGNARTGLLTIGQRFQLDECEIGVTIVSERDPSRIIGKAIMHCAFDPYAQMIVGVNVGLKNNSYSGFCDLVMTMLEPHNNQTSLVGVECTDEIFPSMVLPKEIHADHGAEYESKALEQSMCELGIKTSLVPAAAGSYKGGVENVFMRLQHILRNKLIDAGYIMPNHEGAKKARKEACMTLKDMREIVYKIVLDLNQAPLPGYSPDLEMLEAGIALSPAEIWKFEAKRKGNPVCVSEQAKERVLFALLSRDKRFKITRAGIEYVGHSLRYFTEDEWFLSMIKEKEPDVEIRYNDQCVDVVYVRYKKEIRKVPLAVKREELQSFIGMSWHEYDMLWRELKERQKQCKETALNRRLDTESDIRKIADAAKVLQGDASVDAKHIKENRREEKKELQSGDTETRNRLLDNIAGETPNISPVSKKPVPVENKGYLDDYSDDDLADLLGEG